MFDGPADSHLNHVVPTKPIEKLCWSQDKFIFPKLGAKNAKNFRDPNLTQDWDPIFLKGAINLPHFQLEELLLFQNHLSKTHSLGLPPTH